MLHTNRERLAVGLVAASMLGYVGVSYVQRKRRSAARVVPPQHGAVLHLVNMSSTEAAALSSVFSSWSSSFKPILTQTMAYELDQTTLLSTVQMEAMTAFTEVGSSGPCVTMRIGATFGHEKDAIEEDATWPTPMNDLKRFASTYAGAPLTLTVYLAYADRPQYCEVFQHKVTGVTCSLAQIDNTFTSLEDLLVLNTPLPELFPRLAHLFPIEKDLAMGALRGNRIALEYASLHLSKMSELARGMEGGTLLLRPHRWRAYTDLAYAIMYRWQENALQSTKPWTLGQCLTSTGKTFAASLGLTEAQRREYTRHLLQFDPKDPLCGRFENHITVNFEGSEDAEAECQRFIDTAAAIGVKIVSIALPKGSTFPAQVMTSYYTSGRVKECTLALLEMGMFLTLRGFKCARVKMELQLSEDLSSSFFMKPHNQMDVDPRLIGLCPVQDEPAADARNMSEVQYFEFHVKLGIPEARVTEATPLVKAVGQEHNAHLSKNAFKVYSGEPNSASDASERLLLYFLTLRVYRTGFATCVQRMHALRAAAEAALAPVGGRVTTVQREYSVFDSNTGLDAGWFDRSAATPSFMLAE